VLYKEKKQSYQPLTPSPIILRDINIFKKRIIITSPF
jgi:hypothetical protein